MGRTRHAERVSQPGGGKGQCGLSWQHLRAPASPSPVFSTRDRFPSSQEAPGKGGRHRLIRLAPLLGNSGGCSQPGPAGPALRLPRKICVFFSANTRLQSAVRELLPEWLSIRYGSGGGEEEIVGRQQVVGEGPPRTSIFRWSQRGGSSDSLPWIPAVDDGAGLLLRVQESAAEV